MTLDANTSLLSAQWSRRRLLRFAAFGAACAAAPMALSFQSPLEQPAMRSSLITRSPLLGVAYTGRRIVAVGLRGSILFSDDQGLSWTQAEVPVSTDLVAVSFPVPEKGWVVGHGGVVLHSEDGGSTWRKQLDGLLASHQTVAYYESRTASLPEAERFAERERALAVGGETQPLMDVFFANERLGYVVGTFNRIFRTEDGGNTWLPLMDRVDNSDELHFYAVEGRGDQIYLAGEQGRVWRLDPSSGRFTQANTPYNGTLFGLLLGADDVLLAYGMRGNLYRTADQGAFWERIDSVAQGGITSALTLPDGRMLIADQLGGVAQSSDGGRHFTALKMAKPMPYFGASVVADDKIALVGAQGVQIETV